MESSTTDGPERSGGLDDDPDDGAFDDLVAIRPPVSRTSSHAWRCPVPGCPTAEPGSAAARFPDSGIRECPEHRRPLTYREAG